MYKKKIVHILYSFDTGGLEKGIATLIQNSSPDFTHIIISLTTQGSSVSLLPENTEVIALHKKPGNSLPFILKLTKILKEINPDIVHTRNWSGMDGILAARLASIKNIVHGEHGWDMADPFGKNFRRRLVRRFFSRWVKEYTCVSNRIAEWLTNDLNINKPVTRVYNGVDTEKYYPGKSHLCKEYNIPDTELLIGIVARLDPIKDHQTLFQAFMLVQNKVPEARLIIVGDGPERETLENNVSKGILLTGNRTDIPDVLRAFDLFVLSSLNEGVSNTILEAMASGIPIVATRVGGNIEIVENCCYGIHIDPQNPQELAKALLYYLENKMIMKQHGKRAREKAVKDFSIQSMILGYESVYRRVVRR